ACGKELVIDSLSHLEIKIIDSSNFSPTTIVRNLMLPFFDLLDAVKWTIDNGRKDGYRSRMRLLIIKKMQSLAHGYANGRVNRQVEREIEMQSFVFPTFSIDEKMLG